MYKTLLALALLPVLAVPALAQARLLRSTPAAGAKIQSPAHIVLRFSEALEPAFSGAFVLDRVGRNFSGERIEVSGPLMTLTPGHLAPGVYHVAWHAVGLDTKKREGAFSFTVRR